MERTRQQQEPDIGTATAGVFLQSGVTDNIISSRLQAQLDELAKLSFTDFNTRIGLPRHPQTNEPAPLMPVQLGFWDTIERVQDRYHKFHLNKSRQSGWSELMLRIGAKRSFTKYAGWSCKIVAGTRVKTTIKLMQRFKNLFHSIPDVVENNGDKLYIELKNGCNWEGLPANPEAPTGDTKIKCFLMDESAKWDLIDDQPVLNAVMPIVNTNKSDLFIFSTPKGPRGFFYRIETEQNDFMKFKYNIWVTEGYLYTKEEIMKMLADQQIDTAQEYLNQYTSGRHSVFGNADSFATQDFEIEKL